MAPVALKRRGFSLWRRGCEETIPLGIVDWSISYGVAACKSSRHRVKSRPVLNAAHSFDSKGLAITGLSVFWPQTLQGEALWREMASFMAKSS